MIRCIIVDLYIRYIKLSYVSDIQLFLIIDIYIDEYSQLYFAELCRFYILITNMIFNKNIISIQYLSVIQLMNIIPKYDAVINRA